MIRVEGVVRRPFAVELPFAEKDWDAMDEGEREFAVVEGLGEDSYPCAGELPLEIVRVEEL